MLTLTPKQREAAALLGSESANILLYGGSGSGKTAVICWRLVHNAISCPGSRQAVLRKHLNGVRTSIGLDTLPFVFEMEKISCKYNERDHVFRFRNGSEIWLLGLDDKERTEKVLGKGFFTMYYNECSEISWLAVQMGMTRNRIRISRDLFGRPRRNRIYFDCNPPSKRHWSYKAFVLKHDPGGEKPWKHPQQWNCMKMNPNDNREHLGDEYIEGVLGTFTGRMKKRFFDGDFSDDSGGSLWNQNMIDPYRVYATPEDLERIVVGVDPAVTSGENSDSTGIVVAGRKTTGSMVRYYVLSDNTIKGSPECWAATVQRCYEKYRADCIVVETNNGGNLVVAVLRATNRDLPIKTVHANRGKLLRAEPIAGIYEQGRVHHVGEFSELEDQMCDYTGEANEKSPDNLDALVYALTELSGEGTIARFGSFSFG